ncbi:carbohydrate ABC transporter permease [Candidatus Roseilinea sp. NK_OTU-006]|jgi:ABC-type glycerol-3-phosphate transport system permease component|nr:carbohydrate ABC transporter permease [Candidatus Roseilinea sp. NK_OTU-006]
MATQAITPSLATGRPGSRQLSRIAGLVILQIVMTVCLITFLAPTFWMISSSLKASTEVFQHPIVWIPESPQWSNYAKVFQTLPFAKFAWNTFVVVVLAVFGTVVSTALVAYGLARVEFPGRRILFALMVATIMLPDIVTLIPRFIMFRTFRWIDTFAPLTVPFWFALTTLYVFLMYQFLRGIPKELDEAATIDGANRWQILWHVILPLCKPVIATIAVFALIQHYNEFLTPLIYLNRLDNWTLALGVRALNDSNVANWELVFAASTLMLIPALLLFIVAQRYFVQGIALTGFGGR